jgi:hypothetical protein
MPLTRLLLYREDDGTLPLIDWLQKQQPKVIAKCRVSLGRLSELGYELRRPEADYLRDDIYELRVGMRGQNYRMLYFFYGRDVVVVSHGLTKEAAVPAMEIDRAINRRNKFLASPTQHTGLFATEEPQDEDGKEEEKQGDQQRP